MTHCRIEGCESPVSSRGLCVKHYGQHRHAGTLDQFPRRTTHELFWEKVTDGPVPAAAPELGPCLDWTGARNQRKGELLHGIMRVAGRTRMVHRLAWEWENGPIPDGMMLDHICQRPQCVQVSHLRLSTNARNLQNRKGPSRSNRTSKYRGVHWNKRAKLWQTHCTVNGVRSSAGYFKDEDEAGAAIARLRAQLMPDSQSDRPVT